MWLFLFTERFFGEPKIFYEIHSLPWAITLPTSEKSFWFCTFFGFLSFSAYLNPFQQWLTSIFHTEDIWGTLLQKVEKNAVTQEEVH